MPKELKNYFFLPSNSTHRQYEALRAYFAEGLPQSEVAAKFGYTIGSFRVLCHEFRQNPQRQFFVVPQRGPLPGKVPGKENIKIRIVTLRKQNLSIYDIADRLKADNRILSPQAIAQILKTEGFAKLPRRRDDERPALSGIDRAGVADVNELCLKNRTVHTKFGGLFLFVPFLARIPFDEILDTAGFPGSKMIPPSQAMRSHLALKLFGNARHTHVMSDVFDEGLALFAGLNVIPKQSFLSQYSCRIDPAVYPKTIDLWFDAAAGLGMRHGNSFDLDFHTIPFHGEDALMEKHYISKRSRRQKGIMSFVVNDDKNRCFCYVNADIRKATMKDEVIKFAQFWKKKNGSYPDELIFDSQLTTYANLDRLNKMGINFITLRRRSEKMLDEIDAVPRSAWRRVELANIAREYRTPRVLSVKISLDDYRGQLRQLAVKDLGHEKPTILISNQMRRSPASLIQRYARRMLIENNIADAIDFFHMDALSSTVAMKVNCDLLLTLMGSSLYRLFAMKIGHGYETAKFGKIFRDFIYATANLTIDNNRIQVKFHKRSHNPLLIKAGYAALRTPVPWLDGKELEFKF